jgi:hypothetical protein
MGHLQGEGMGHIEGLVVVPVKLDRQWKVVDAGAISVDEGLKISWLTNGEKWQFAPNSQHVAILVYDFRRIKALAFCGPDDESLFVFCPPSFVSFTGCGFTVQPH